MSLLTINQQRESHTTINIGYFSRMLISLVFVVPKGLIILQNFFFFALVTFGNVLKKYRIHLNEVTQRSFSGDALALEKRCPEVKGEHLSGILQQLLKALSRSEMQVRKQPFPYSFFPFFVSSLTAERRTAARLSAHLSTEPADLDNYSDHLLI